MTSTRPRQTTPFGRALRRWRTSRRLSQLELAARAETPPRHVSFLETGRSRPSEEMVMRLGAAMELPLHERNALLTAAGFHAAFPERSLDDEALGPVRQVIDRLLASHAPFPGIVIDRWYDILAANLGGRRLFLGGAEVDPDDPTSLVDLLLGPLRALAVNWDELVWDALVRMRRDVADAPDDDRLASLLARVEEAAAALPPPPVTAGLAPVLFTRARLGGVEIKTLSTLVHFGGSRDVTVDGLHLELVFPADPETEAVLMALGR